MVPIQDTVLVRRSTRRSEPVRVSVSELSEFDWAGWSGGRLMWLGD